MIMRMRHRPVIAAVSIALLLSAAVPAARADKATAEDAKYHKVIDSAVDSGLQYIAKAQLADGSFRGGMSKCNAVASLCVMAFLAKGYQPGIEPYGDTINHGVDFVLASADPANGYLGSDGGGVMYSHNISVLMLSEVSGMVDPERQKRIDAVLPKATQLTLSAQKISKPAAQQGGWRYSPGSTDSDMSHSGWAIMALRSARNAVAPVPREAIDDGIKFVKRCLTVDGGCGYQPGGGASFPLTGAALLCIELSGEHRTVQTRRAGQYILQSMKQQQRGNTHFYYSMYYCSQGMFQLGESEWQEFAPLLYETLIKLQGADGAWQNVSGGSEDRAGPCYRTAMACLALSVSYRQLPIYQR